MGTEKFVKITWLPPANFDVSELLFIRIFEYFYFVQPNEACRAAITVTTKGDVTRTWRVILVGYVDLISSSEKRSSRSTKNSRMITTGRSGASLTSTAQQLTTHVSTHEDNTNNTLAP